MIFIILVKHKSRRLRLIVRIEFHSGLCDKAVTLLSYTKICTVCSLGNLFFAKVHPKCTLTFGQRINSGCPVLDRHQPLIQLFSPEMNDIGIRNFFRKAMLRHIDRKFVLQMSDSRSDHRPAVLPDHPGKESLTPHAAMLFARS